MQRSLDLVQLRSFLAVADQLGFTRRRPATRIEPTGGQPAAALARLGVLPFTRSLTPPGLVEQAMHSPYLGQTRFTLASRRRRTSTATQALVRSIRAHHDELHTATDGHTGVIDSPC